MHATMQTGRGALHGRALRDVGALVLPIALVLVIFPPLAAMASPQTYYLDGDGIPIASLATASPTGSLVNHDPARDSDPGLVLKKTNRGSAETDATKYQLWLSPSGDLDLDGTASFTFWSAMKDFNQERAGGVNAYLLDCPATGTSCSVIDSASSAANPWNPGGSWVSRTLSFGVVTYTIASDRRLGLKITVDATASNDSMWIAYDAGSYPSRLTVDLAVATTTTTSTTTTTTTTTTTIAPIPTTTTTTEPPPTPTTTTTAPPGSTTTTTTTTTPGGTTTTTGPGVTTTSAAPGTTTTPTTTAAPTTSATTGPPPGEESPGVDSTTTTQAPGIVAQPGKDPPPPEPTSAEHDAAMTALPTIANSNSAVGQRGMSAALFDDLEVVIPPLVASAILSPLVLFEALIGAFVETGRDLVFPGILLLLVAGWMGNDLRRQRRTANRRRA